ncbi:Phosphatidylinositol 3; 4; 5-trisphosphate 5-phosphatase 1, partial [Camelus dromedarius]
QKEKKKQRIREAKIKKTTEHQNVSSESGGLGWEILDVLARKEVTRIFPSLESLQKLFDQQLSPGLRPRPQGPAEANPVNVVAKLSQLTSLLSSIEDKVKALLHEGPESSHRRSLIPPVTFEVKSESLGIAQKLQLKVDVESGKLIIKKSKDGSEDKFYSHKKSKAS